MRTAILPFMLAMLGLGVASTGASAYAAAAATGIAPVPVTNDGLVGQLFQPAHAHGRQPALIVLGGSEGGVGAGAARLAASLAEHGYVTLQLGYFGAPGLPQTLGLVPLEYFGKAIAWLARQKQVDPRRIGIVGGSFGGEAALVVAAQFPQLKVVVAAVPSSVVWPGIAQGDAEPPSTFSLAGKPLPYLPYGWTGTFKDTFSLYDEGLKAVDQHPDAIIRVERIRGPVLLICGKQDSLWPSCPMSQQVVDRLKAKGFKHGVVLLDYDDAGHASFGLPADPAQPGYATLASLGGSADGNNAARKDAWPKPLKFLDAALRR